MEQGLLHRTRRSLASSPHASRLLYLLALLAACPSTFAFIAEDTARAVIVVSGERQNEALTPALRYVEDVMHRHPGDVQPEQMAHLPWRPADASLSRGGTSRSQWLLRVPLQNFDDVDRERVLAVLHPTLDDVHLTLHCSNGYELNAVSGDIHPLSSRPLPDRHPSFPVTIPASTECTAWFVVNTADTFQFPARILDTYSYSQLVLSDFLLRTLGLGMQLLAVILGLAIALQRRDGLAAYFALTVMAQTFLILVLADLGYVLLWGEMPRLQKALAPAAIWLGWALTGDLCLRLLPGEAVNRIAARMMMGSLMLACVAAIMQIVDPDPSHMALLVGLCAVGMVLLLTITGGAVLVGAAHAGLVTGGIVAITLGGILEASGFLGLLPLGTGYLIPLHGGFLLAAVLFGIALWYRIDDHLQRRGTDREIDRRVAERTRSLSSTVAELTSTNRKLNLISRSDMLTGTFNRHFMDNCLAHYAQDANNTPLSFILFDIDFFKAVNDTHGHPVGDQCLRTVANCVQRQLRQDKDVLCRYGGEEFAVILPNTDLDGAKRVAEKIRTAVAGLAMHSSTGSELHITVSLGVSTLQEAGDPQRLVGSADQALYSAKRSGRNRWRAAAV